MNWKTHVISFLIFAFSFATLKLVWDNPKIILYIVLAVVAVIAYGAIYLVVKAKVDNKTFEKME
ncbi:MAG: hypothetical protein IPJ69_10255 [Deltaproteobacteria bacterium]|nr:MAG: hypothetical protein IPJ69_10255 [Deltaproteobacteria bacterium]